MWYLSLIIFVFGLTLAYFNTKFSYWKRKEIFSCRALIPWGSFRNILEDNVEEQLETFHRYFRYLRVSYGGLYLFTQPIFQPVNAELIRQILIKDFAHFSTRCSYHNFKGQKLCGHVYYVGGYKWRKLSEKVKIILSVPKFKSLLPVIIQSYEPLTILLELYAKEEHSIDAKVLVENITRDAFIVSVLGMNSNDDFQWFEERLFTKSTKEIILDHLRMMYPNLARFLGVVRYPREAEEFFADTVLKYIKRRHKNSINHADFMQLLMELHDHDHEHDFMPEEDKMSMYDIINQCFFFYVHGFQCSKQVLCFALYELGKNPCMQGRIRSEIRQNIGKHHGTWSYEEFNELKYLEQVIDEILRKYPPIKFLERKCTRRYKLPHVDKHIERGTKVLISVLGVHKDATIYIEPERFNPDRFADKMKDKLQKQCSYLAFGEGRRGCPGERFAVVQLKIALVTILRDFEFYLTPGGTNPLEEGLLLQFRKVAENLPSHRRISTISIAS